MLNRFLFRVILLVVLVGGGVLVNYSTAQATVPTPTLLRVELTDNPARPWVVGLTPNNVQVEVWLDGKSVGWAKVVNSPSGTASFGWSPSYDLKPGVYEVKVRGKFGDNFSNFSQILLVNIPQPTPEPVLVEPEIFDDYVLIRGLLANNTKVKIYIDDKLWADFAVPNHPSGTTNFWFKARGLLNGEHIVYARAYDSSGKLSKISNKFTFSTEFQPVTGGEARTEADQPQSKQDQAETSTDSRADNKQIKSVDQPDGDKDNKKEGVSGELEESQEEKDQDLIKLFGNSTTSVSEVDQLDDDQMKAKEERNRLIGFGLLVIIVVLLLSWYKLEQKRLLSKSGKQQEDSGDSDKNKDQNTSNTSENKEGESRPESSESSDKQQENK